MGRTGLILVLGVVLAAATSACAVRMVVPGPPPAARVEVRGVAPGPAFVWIGGYWAWRSGWVWTPGSWVRRPHPRAVWVPGHWDHIRGGWRWTPGRWR
jgi:hypothetical protein